MKLEEVAQYMVGKPRGLLAIDESSPTIKKRFDSVGIEDSEENRRHYRELLISTANLGKYISGAILFEETLFQYAEDGRPIVDHLEDQKILPGIKVDQGLEVQSNGEKLTRGLDDLPERLIRYHKAGAKFAKWRAVIMIGEGMPTRLNIQESALRLAEYAHACQEAGLVPVVESEVLMDGAHSIELCAEVTGQTLEAVYEALAYKHVNLQGTVLKPNMVAPGSESEKASPAEVARATIDVMKEFVPPEVPGLTFLSGGIGDEDITQYLNAMNAMGEHLPWNLTFSFGRGLQRGALAAFAEGDFQKAQTSLLIRAMASSNATLGKYACMV